MVYSEKGCSLAVSVAAKATLEGIHIHMGGGGGGEEGDGVDLIDVASGGLHVRGCTFRTRAGPAWAAVAIHGGARAVVEGCSMEGGRCSGVHVFPGGGGVIEGCSLEDNAGAVGIWVVAPPPSDREPSTQQPLLLVHDNTVRGGLVGLLHRSARCSHYGSNVLSGNACGGGASLPVTLPDASSSSTPSSITVTEKAKEMKKVPRVVTKKVTRQKAKRSNAGSGGGGCFACFGGGGGVAPEETGGAVEMEEVTVSETVYDEVEVEVEKKVAVPGRRLGGPEQGGGGVAPAQVGGGSQAGSEAGTPPDCGILLLSLVVVLFRAFY